jgi:hypothetical protein
MLKVGVVRDVVECGEAGIRNGESRQLQCKKIPSSAATKAKQGEAG